MEGNESDLIAALRARDRQARRDLRAAQIRLCRYLTRTPLEQQRADTAEYNRRVLERGWIVAEPPQTQVSGVN